MQTSSFCFLPTSTPHLLLLLLLSIFLLFLCFFRLLSSVSFHPGRPPKYSSVPELGSLTPTSPSSPVHPLPLPSPSSGDVSNDLGGDGTAQTVGRVPSHTTAPAALQLPTHSLTDLFTTPRLPHWPFTHPHTHTSPLVCCLHVTLISLITRVYFIVCLLLLSRPLNSALQSEQRPVADSIH